jgi:hypothetical protein
MSASSRQLPAAMVARFSTQQPAVLGRPAEIGQERTFGIYLSCHNFSAHFLKKIPKCRRFTLLTIKRSAFSVKCRDDLAAQATWLSTIVENLGDSQAHLIAGAAFQIGWSVLKLVDTTQGLMLCEPDFDNDPIYDFREDVSSTLDVLHAQQTLMSKVGCSPTDIRFDDKVVIFRGCLEEARIYGERREPEKGDSGWYFGPTREHSSPSANDLEFVFAYQLLHRRPQLVSAMCLPANWIVVWEGQKVVGIADSDNKERLL